ncbi:hypothetical protein Brsp07_04541 [Brucella sp. NBRC 14130]|uniref:hypothetical protein n=1 Tax=Brucella sp. NBRC 14130 TaxID=3075483 RepID=UPI0030A79A31
MATYRLGSSDFAHAPGLIAWAINGYAFKKDQTTLRKIVADTWGIPGDIAHKLLSKEISYKIEDEKVVFSVEDKAGR